MVKVTPYKEEYYNKLVDCLNSDPTENMTEQILKDIKNIKNTEEYLVCFDDEQNIIGMSKTTLSAAALQTLDFIFVKPSCRRETNGSIILVAVLTRAVNRLIAALVCSCEKNRDAAAGFFKARGFTFCGEDEKNKYYSKNLLYMYKTQQKKDDK